MLNLSQINTILNEIDKMFPNAHCELVHQNEFELLIAVMLSAQTTDQSVNKVTPNLFREYKTPKDFIELDIGEIEKLIRKIGLYRNKAKHIKNISKMLVEKYNGKVPNSQEELESLPGVGRKTANVVRSVAFDVPRIAVDTHVERVSKRLGIARWKDTPLQVEKVLMKKIPIDRWSKTHHQLIFFGRYHCTARSPKCDVCPLLDMCREGKKVMKKKHS